MRLLNLLKLGLALASVMLLGFAAVARADQGVSSLGGPSQAIATAEGRAASPVTASPQAGELDAESIPAAATPTDSSSGDAPSGLPPEADQTSEGSAPLSGPQADAGTANEASPGQSSPAHALDLPAAPQASASGISEAVKEASLRASASPQGGSAAGTADPAAAESNATTQLIWQVQVSECAAHCSDTKQYQLAEQHNTTRQTLAGVPGAANGQTLQPTAERAQATTSTTSIQLACIAYCYGTTTTMGTQIAGAVRQVVEALLGQLAAGLPGLRPTPAAEQATVEQIAYQSQSGPAGTLVQTQSAFQDSTTVQSYDAATALARGLGAALGGGPAASDEAVNQTEQGIWQLQIGCLIFCERTQQYQQAAQSNTTVQNRSTAHAESAGGSAANTATQLIWQAQVGCLLWCFDATEQQTATASNELVVLDGDQPPAPSPAETTSPAAGSGTEPTASAGASPSPGARAEPEPPTGSQGGSEASAAALANPLLRPRPSSGAGAPAQAAAVAAAAGTRLRSTTSTWTAHKSRVGMRRSHLAPPPGIPSGSVVPATGARVALPTVHARHAGTAARLSRAGDAARLPAAAPGMTLGMSGSATPSVLAGALLAAIALVGLCCLPIALLFTRRGARASDADH